MMFGAMLLLRVQREQFLPTGDQGGQALLGGTGRQRGRGLEKLSVFGEGGATQPIRFGEQSLGAGKLAGMAGIEERDGQGGLVEGLQQEVFVTAGGFADD